MNPFAYARADDAASAVAMLDAAAGATYLGGGTSLVDLMKLRVELPSTLVDVARLPSGGVELLADGGVRVGGAVRNADLASDRTIRARYPVLAQALLSGASPQLRNLATTAGNLVQRTRCAYFRDASLPCNKRAPGSGCPARDGANRELAIFGWSDACVATHPSDMAVAMTALDATVRVRGTDGERTIPIGELYRLPGDEPRRDTNLRPGDLVVSVDLPPLGASTRSLYRNVRDRASYAFALVSLAAAVDARGGVIRDVRLALGGVAHRPWRAFEAERVLRGAAPTAETFRAAADAELALARPLAGNGFKTTLVRNLVSAVLGELTATA